MYRKFSLYPHKKKKKKIVSEGFAKVYDDGDDDDDDWKSEYLLSLLIPQTLNILRLFMLTKTFLSQFFFTLAAIIKNRHFFYCFVTAVFFCKKWSYACFLRQHTYQQASLTRGENKKFWEIFSVRSESRKLQLLCCSKKEIKENFLFWSTRKFFFFLSEKFFKKFSFFLLDFFFVLVFSLLRAFFEVVWRTNEIWL